MEGPYGGSVSIEVSDTTSYLGSLNSFADLSVGDNIAVIGQRSGEGYVDARVVVLRDDLPMGARLGGEVTATTSSTLTLQTPSGETFKFNVTSSTEYLSRDNSVAGISDIEVGDHVMVIFEQASSGTLSANLIAVGGPQADGSQGNGQNGQSSNGVQDGSGPQLDGSGYHG